MLVKLGMDDFYKSVSRFCFKNFSWVFRDVLYTTFDSLRMNWELLKRNVPIRDWITVDMRFDLVSRISAKNRGEDNSQSIQLIISGYSFSIKLNFIGMNVLTIFLLASICFFFAILRNPSSLMFFLSFWVMVKSKCSGWAKKIISFNHRVDNIKQIFWQISGKLYYLIKKFRAVYMIITSFNRTLYFMWFQWKPN